MNYEEPKQISKEAVQRALVSSSQIASDALIRAALTIDDWEWVESVLVGALSDQRYEVRRAALVALGHVVRLHHRLHLDKVVPLVQRCALDSNLAGTAEDTLEDIAMFTKGDANLES
ncbi:MAG: hypothetical protein LAN70_15340 [Acidobacteriia bacterium]|nr:hypothetical protein [Terriglobia bacterium]